MKQLPITNFQLPIGNVGAGFPRPISVTSHQSTVNSCFGPEDVGAGFPRPIVSSRENNHQF
jgi:hypothetical protein